MLRASDEGVPSRAQLVKGSPLLSPSTQGGSLQVLQHPERNIFPTDSLTYSQHIILPHIPLKKEPFKGNLGLS